MIGNRFVGVVYADGEVVSNQLMSGLSSNNKKDLLRKLHNALEFAMMPKWIAEHKVEYHILDRMSGETIII